MASLSDSTHNGPGPNLAVVVPCRNEERDIAECVRSLARNDLARSTFEIVVVDGMSTDGTRKEIDRVREELPGSTIRVVENPKRSATAAFNLGLKHSSAPVVALASAHSHYPVDYLRLLLEGLEATGADCVGGRLVTEAASDTAVAKAIAVALSHPFGVGNSAMRTAQPSEPVDVDSVGFGCWKRETLEALGGFDERIARSQDFALANRLRRAGGRIVMLPRVYARYVARGTIRELVHHNLSNGYWVTFPALTAEVRFAPRHFAPLVFVAALGSGLLPARLPRFTSLGTLTAYLTCLAPATAGVYRRTGSARTAAASAMVFPLIHVSYGVGSLGGILSGLRTRWSRRDR